jgi:DNA-directed RNA polymerase subunit RPC12/RpoP
MLLIEFLFDKANPVNMSSDSLSESVNRSSDMTPELSLTILPSITRIFFFDVYYICSVCKKQFEDLDRLLRHQWKKHPSIHCHYLQVEHGHEIECLRVQLVLTI